MDVLEPLYIGYENVKSYAAAKLAAYGYGDPSLDDVVARMPTFSPGPAGDARALKLTPEALVFLTVGSGPGLTKDGAFDRSFVNVRAIGRQGDYAGAERLAYALDRAFLAFESSDFLDPALADIWTLYITRSGGPPSLLMRDTAERYHFTCSYITEAETGL